MLCLQTATGILIASESLVEPSTNAELLIVCLLQIMSFIYCTYITARFIEVTNYAVMQTVELRKRTLVFEEFAQTSGIPAHMTAKVKHYLTARFDDILEARKHPQREEIINEVPATVRGDMLFHAYGTLIKGFPFFANLPDDILIQMCTTAKKRAFVRGEIVRDSRSPGPGRAHWSSDEGIQFVMRGAVLSSAEMNLTVNWAQNKEYE